MIKFSLALNAWLTPLFSDMLQQEIKQLNEAQLFLQQALKHGSHATVDDMKLIMLSANDDNDYIYAKVGVFYNSVVSGCHCDDDPSPMSVEIEYCELNFSLNKKTAEVDIELLD